MLGQRSERRKQHCKHTQPITFHFPHATDLQVERFDEGHAAGEPQTRVQPGTTLKVLVLELVALDVHQSHLSPCSFASSRVSLHGGRPGTTGVK